MLSVVRSAQKEGEAGLGMAGDCLRREERAGQREHQDGCGVRVDMGISEEQQATWAGRWWGGVGGKSFLSLGERTSLFKSE